MERFCSQNYGRGSAVVFSSSRFHWKFRFACLHIFFFSPLPSGLIFLVFVVIFLLPPSVRKKVSKILYYFLGVVGRLDPFCFCWQNEVVFAFSIAVICRLAPLPHFEVRLISQYLLKQSRASSPRRRRRIYRTKESFMSLGRFRPTSLIYLRNLFVVCAHMAWKFGTWIFCAGVEDILSHTYSLCGRGIFVSPMFTIFYHPPPPHAGAEGLETLSWLWSNGSQLGCFGGWREINPQF